MSTNKTSKAQHILKEAQEHLLAKSLAKQSAENCFCEHPVTLAEFMYWLKLEAPNQALTIWVPPNWSGDAGEYAQALQNVVGQLRKLGIDPKSTAPTSRIGKTLYLGDMRLSTRPEFKYQAPCVDFIRRKWRQDTWYFDDPAVAEQRAKEQGFTVKTNDFHQKEK
ncbi:MAG: hypothetical protein U9Q82_03265 [Chloroflexota bacterium]|nr:hypothetical protein [Chloroflexota bacterium]